MQEEAYEVEPFRMKNGAWQYSAVVSSDGCLLKMGKCGPWEMVLWAWSSSLDENFIVLWVIYMQLLACKRKCMRLNLSKWKMEHSNTMLDMLAMLSWKCNECSSTVDKSQASHFVFIHSMAQVGPPFFWAPVHPTAGFWTGHSENKRYSQFCEGNGQRVVVTWRLE